MSVDRIEVVCDDPRHEPEPVETFVRRGSAAAGYPGEPIPDGEWVTEQQLRPTGRDGRPEQTGWSHHRQKRDLGETVHSYRCDSCPWRRRPGQFECTEAALQAMLNDIAAQGLPTVTVRFINVLLSRGRKHVL